MSRSEGYTVCGHHSGGPSCCRAFFDDPIYLVDDVVHYCVPNVPGSVPRTSTHAFNNAAWSYIRHVAEMGVASAMAQNEALRRGVVMRNGEIIDDTGVSYGVI